MLLAAYALFHMVAIFPLGYIKLFAELPASGLLLMQMADGFLTVFTCILSDPLADRFGRRLFLIVVTAVIGILSFSSSVYWIAPGSSCCSVSAYLVCPSANRMALGLTIWLGLDFAGYYLMSGAVATLIALYILQRMSSKG